MVPVAVCSTEDLARKTTALLPGVMRGLNGDKCYWTPEKIHVITENEAKLIEMFYNMAKETNFINYYLEKEVHFKFRQFGILKR